MLITSYFHLIRTVIYCHQPILDINVNCWAPINSPLNLLLSTVIKKLKRRGGKKLETFIHCGLWMKNWMHSIACQGLSNMLCWPHIKSRFLPQTWPGCLQVPRHSCFAVLANTTIPACTISSCSSVFCPHVFICLSFVSHFVAELLGPHRQGFADRPQSMQFTQCSFHSRIISPKVNAPDDIIQVTGHW